MLLLQMIVDGIISGCAIGAVSITFSYVYSTTGVFHVAHAGIYTLGSYVAWYLVEKHVPFFIALALAMAVCAAVGAFLQKSIYEPLLKRKASPLVMLIASLGALAVLQNAISIAFTPDLLWFNVGWRLHMADIGPIHISYPQVWTGVLCFLVLIGLLLFSSRTLLGQRIRAVASNPHLAEITRLKPYRVYIYVLAIASALVCVPAAVVGLDQNIQPYTSVNVLLVAVIAMIAGGIGSLPGAFIMSIVIQVLQNFILLWVPGRWSIAFVFILFIAFILIKPSGLFRTRLQRAS